MIRFPLEIQQAGPPRPAWQTFQFWFEALKDILIILVTLGGAAGWVVIATIVAEALLAQ